MKTITLTPDASGMVDWPTLSNDKKSVVTIGSFDGMHQGHQAVIRRVAELAEREQAFSVVVLFDPRPALVHAYAAKHDGQEPPAGTPDTQALTSVDERLRAIDGVGELRLMLTVDSGTKRELAQDTTAERSGSEDMKCKSETVVVGTGSGTQEVVVTNRVYPRYVGALVVCEGGGSAGVRLAVTQAVSALTALPSDKITVLQGKP